LKKTKNKDSIKNWWRKEHINRRNK